MEFGTLIWFVALYLAIKCGILRLQRDAAMEELEALHQAGRLVEPQQEETT